MWIYICRQVWSLSPANTVPEVGVISLVSLSVSCQIRQKNNIFVFIPLDSTWSITTFLLFLLPKTTTLVLSLFDWCITQEQVVGARESTVNDLVSHPFPAWHHALELTRGIAGVLFWQIKD